MAEVTFLIDQEFKRLLPELSSTELNQLEANIIKDGCRDPIVVWSGIIVDGSITGSELALPHSIIPKAMTNEQTRTVSYSCLDRNGHMNNTRYLDLLCDHIPDFRSRMVTSIGIKFKAEAPLGETIKLYRAKMGDTYYFRTIRSDGQINIEAEIETKIIE